jgi:hypothetical protein
MLVVTKAAILLIAVMHCWNSGEARGDRTELA